MTDTQALLAVIEESGIKKGFIAQKLGLSRQGLDNKINNLREFKASEIETLCTVLNINSLIKRQEIFFAKQVD